MIGHTVAELLDGHVGLDLEGIDRLYLNLYQPRLQTGGGVVGFFKGHRGAQVASSPREFAAAVQAFASMKAWRSCVSRRGSARTTRRSGG